MTAVHGATGQNAMVIANKHESEIKMKPRKNLNHVTVKVFAFSMYPMILMNILRLVQLIKIVQKETQFNPLQGNGSYLVLRSLKGKSSVKILDCESPKTRLTNGSTSYPGSLPYIVRLTFQTFDQYHSDSQAYFTNKITFVSISWHF